MISSPDFITKWKASGGHERGSGQLFLTELCDLLEVPREIGERAFEFAVRVVKVCQKLDERPGVPRTLANQLLRSATSIGANLEESKGGQSRADFISKVSISLKEARETHYWIRLLIATEILPEKQLADLLDESNQIVAILTTIVKRTKSN